MAELIVSELTTNAMLVSRRLGRLLIRLTLTLDHRELAIAVHDYCPGTPEPGNAADDDAEGGRGLLLVEAVSSRSGWYPFEDGSPGKVVWAALPS
jgi:anti-sigma regulatory factor (Ser/Thr protein kinase)